MSATQRVFRALAYTAGVGVLGIGGTLGGMRLWTRKSYFEEFTPETDALWHLGLLKKINPHDNPSLNDSCVRRIPFEQLKPELLEDQRRGGDKLVNAFCQGMWGGYGYAVQLGLENRLKERSKDNQHDLWTKEELLACDYPVGTTITDHLQVVSRTGNSIIMRGPTPRPATPDELLDMDNIGELAVQLNEQDQVAEFRFKNIFFVGKGKQTSPPFPEFVASLHYLYARFLTESGVARCVR